MRRHVSCLFLLRGWPQVLTCNTGNVLDSLQWNNVSQLNSDAEKILIVKGVKSINQLMISVILLKYWLRNIIYHCEICYQRCFSYKPRWEIKLEPPVLFLFAVSGVREVGAQVLIGVGVKAPAFWCSVRYCSLCGRLCRKTHCPWNSVSDLFSGPGVHSQHNRLHSDQTEGSRRLI